MRKIKALICLMLLTGCTSPVQPAETPEATPEPVKVVAPVTSYINVINAFDESGKTIIMDCFDEQDDIPQAFSFVGTDMPHIEVKGYNSPNFDIYAKADSVIEITGYWCSHCKQEVEYMEDILKENPGVNFIQIFGDGVSDDPEEGDQVAAFFSSTTGMPDVRIAEETSEFNTYAFDEIGVEAYPTFLFFNEEGKLSFVYEGTLDVNKFSKVAKYAFDEDNAIYKKFAGGYSSVFDSIRYWDDVRDDLTDEAVAKVSDLMKGIEGGEETAYGNMGMPMDFSDSYTDLNGRTFASSDLKNRTVYFLVEYQEKDASIEMIDGFKERHPDVNVVMVLFSQSETPENAVLKDGYVFDAFGDLPPVLYPVVIYNLPTVLYVDEDLKVSMGGFNGQFEEDSIEKAFSVFDGKDAPYKSVK